MKEERRRRRRGRGRRRRRRRGWRLIKEASGRLGLRTLHARGSLN